LSNACPMPRANLPRSLTRALDVPPAIRFILTDRSDLLTEAVTGPAPRLAMLLRERVGGTVAAVAGATDRVGSPPCRNETTFRRRVMIFSSTATRAGVNPRAPVTQRAGDTVRTCTHAPVVEERQVALADTATATVLRSQWKGVSEQRLETGCFSRVGPDQRPTTDSSARVTTRVSRGVHASRSMTTSKRPFGLT
jgi:hypothetical protein